MFAALLIVGLSYCRRDTIAIVSAFPGGNGTVVGRARNGAYDVAVRRDADSDIFQWFAFRVISGSQQPLRLRIIDAHRSFAPSTWAFLRPSVSSDRGRSWRRLPTGEYVDGIYSFEFVPRTSEELVAYAPVYTTKHWHAFARTLQGSRAIVSVDTVAHSEAGRPVEVLRLASRPQAVDSASSVWILARQHPAEVGGSLLLEGLLNWYVGTDMLAKQARDMVTLFVVPIANPDGVEQGHYRLDGSGRDMASYWQRAPGHSSLVLDGIKSAIRQSATTTSRVVMIIDLHSHSTHRRNYALLPIDGDVDGLGRRTVERLVDNLAHLNRDFSRPSSFHTMLSMSGSVTAWGVTAVGAAGLILETTYHDLTESGHPEVAMTPERLAAFGESLGKALTKAFLMSAPLPQLKSDIGTSTGTHLRYRNP